MKIIIQKHLINIINFVKDIKKIKMENKMKKRYLNLVAVLAICPMGLSAKERIAVGHSDNVIVKQEQQKIDDNNTQSDIINLNIDKLIKEVIKRNPNILFDNLQSKIIDNQINYEDGIFTPQFYLNLTHQNLNTPNNTETTLSKGYLSTYSEVSNNAEMGFTGLLPTGAKWNTTLKSNDKKSNLIEKYKEYDTEYDNSLALSINQPLMQGFGSDITKSRYHLAVADKGIFEKQYKKKLMDVMGSVIQTYWRYYGALQLQKSWERSVEVNKLTLNLLTQKAKRGDIAYSEVLEAKSASMIREAELKRVHSELIKIKNEILTLLNISENSSHTIEFNLLDIPNTNDATQNMGVQEYYDAALLNWPELEIAKEKLKKEQLQIELVKNQGRAKLDLVVSANASTLSDQRENQFYDNDFLTWNVGVQFGIPIFNTQSKSALEMAKIKKQQVELEVETLDKGLYNAISTKVESLTNSKQQVKYYNEGLALKEELYGYSQKAFKMGEKSIRDVLVQEEDILDYRRKLFSTIIDWKLSEASLDKASGVLFDKYLTYEDIQKIKDIKVDEQITNENFGKM